MANSRIDKLKSLRGRMPVQESHLMKEEADHHRHNPDSPEEVMAKYKPGRPDIRVQWIYIGLLVIILAAIFGLIYWQITTNLTVPMPYENR